MIDIGVLNVLRERQKNASYSLNHCIHARPQNIRLLKHTRVTNSSAVDDIKHDEGSEQFYRQILQFYRQLGIMSVLEMYVYDRKYV